MSKQKDPRKAFRRNAFLSNSADRLLLAFLVGGVLVFILYPLLCVVQTSVLPDGSVDFSAYDRLFADNGPLLTNSLFVAVLSGLLSTFLGGAVALFVHFGGGRLQKLWMGLLLMTMVSPPFIASLAYIQLFGRRGLITYRLLGLSLNPYGWQGIVAMQSLYFASQSALLLLGVLGKLDGSILNASADLGASPSKTLGGVVLPLLRPALLVCFLLSFIRALSDFGTPMVIGGRFNTLATEIYMQIIGYADLPLAAAMNMLLLLPTVVVFLLYRGLMRRNQALFSAGGKQGGGTGVFHLGGVSRWLVTLPALLFFTMMVLQYGSILLGGFTKSIRGDLHFTLEHFGSLFAYNASTLVRSVVYALVVAVCGTLFGLLLSYYIERRRIRWGGALDFIATLPYMLPGTCFGIGYLLAFNHAPLQLTGTAAIVMLNMLFKQLPIPSKAASAALAQLSTDLDRAGRDLGASRFRVLWDIVLPNLKNAFAVGFITNFAAAMTTVGSILFLINPGQKIAVFTLFDAINSGEYGVASLISTCILVITLAISGGCAKLFLREEGKSHGKRAGITGLM
ncbi:MAG: iron ABC transporter permease [Oscillospiraceae bacterium]